MMASIHKYARENRRLKEENLRLKMILDECHRVNLIRMNALKEAGLPDPILSEEE